MMKKKLEVKDENDAILRETCLMCASLEIKLLISILKRNIKKSPFDLTSVSAFSVSAMTLFNFFLVES